ncbi:MAG: DUF4035 domain-containing protein [Actinomycetota bacterium]|nr:DUF4035 domain-containing protein [Actinomycetota bacterium]
MAFEQLDGPVLGARREDLRAGVIASTIANVNRGKRDRAMSPEDFVLRFEREQDQTPEEQAEQVRRALGGR